MSFTIHQSGIDAAINAQGSGFSGETLSKVKLYNGSTYIKELPMQGVSVIEPSRIYVVTTDATLGESYDVTKMEFYVSSGDLFATAHHDDNSVIQSKGPDSVFSLSEQLNLSAAPGSIMPSGDITLTAPPATESFLGIGKIATQEKVDSGTDDFDWVTSKKLGAWWDNVRIWSNIKNKTTASTTDYGITKEATSEQTKTGLLKGIFVSPFSLIEWWKEEKKDIGRIIGNEIYYLGNYDPRFLFLDGSTIINGVRDFPRLVASNSPFITIDGDDIILMDIPDVIRAKGSSDRNPGDFQNDAIFDISGGFIGYATTSGVKSVEGTGPFYGDYYGFGECATTTAKYYNRRIGFDLSRVVRTANENRMRSTTALLGIWHGEEI